ncbi:MAG: UDP-glucose 4-epimerase GalE [Candidatus Omnitrophota bacterium]
MRILVTGGAGYIGSVCAEELIRQKHETIVIDDLAQGHKEALLPEAVFYQGDFGNKDLLESIFKKHSPEAVIHFAAETLVEFSMSDPGRYFRNNVVCGINLLDTMLKFNCKKLIFSSTAAVFGEPKYSPIDEKHPKNPINAYGESKLMFEKILDWYNRAYGLKFNAFRYFNAAGASELHGEDHDPETHLIPVVIRAAQHGARMKIFGSDYPTKDGTCVRDYVHILDLAQAHILALDNLEARCCARYNLGNSIGYTNLEVVRTVEKVSGKRVDYETVPRRKGDPSELVAASELAKSELGWRPKYESLESIIESAWKWRQRHPQGYADK